MSPLEKVTICKHLKTFSSGLTNIFFENLWKEFMRIDAYLFPFNISFVYMRFFHLHTSKKIPD